MSSSRLARRWNGASDFTETWFIELQVSEDRGLWLRWVLDASLGTAEIWSIAVERNRVVASHKESLPLSAAQPPFLSTNGSKLERDRTLHTRGPIQWNLLFEDRGPEHRHVPRWLTAIGVGRTYLPAILDLAVKGTIEVQGEPWPITIGRGVLGHIWGGPSRVEAWSWCHCNTFHQDGIVFEGLAAQVGPVPMTSLVLHLDGHSYGFSRTRDLVRSRSTTTQTSWSFEASAGDVSLAGSAVLNPDGAATVTYERAGQSPLYCTNSRFSELRLVFRDRARGVELDLRTHDAAFERVGTTALRDPIL